jgi:hypothetical protein
MKREHFDAFSKRKRKEKDKCIAINFDLFDPVQNNDDNNKTNFNIK